MIFAKEHQIRHFKEEQQVCDRRAASCHELSAFLGEDVVKSLDSFHHIRLKRTLMILLDGQLHQDRPQHLPDWLEHTRPEVVLIPRDELIHNSLFLNAAAVKAHDVRVGLAEVGHDRPAFSNHQLSLFEYRNFAERIHLQVLLTPLLPPQQVHINQLAFNFSDIHQCLDGPSWLASKTPEQGELTHYKQSIQIQDITESIH